MPKDKQKSIISRQRPVSCRFCRSRKLRCSRESPCSNCISRAIPCQLDYPVETVPSSPTASKLELLERIRKLEELVETKQSQHDEGVKHHSKSSDAHVQQTYTPTPSPQTERLDDDVAWLESIYEGQDLSVNIFGVLNRGPDLITNSRIRYRPVLSCSGLVQSSASRRRSLTPAKIPFLPHGLSHQDVSGYQNIPKPRYY